MASWDDVRRIALSLPETTEAVSWGNAHWRVKDKGFVWERPLNKSDYAALEALGEEAPEGAILGVRVADLGVRAAMIADDPVLFSTISALRRLPGDLGAARRDRAAGAGGVDHRGVARPGAEAARAAVPRQPGVIS